jgi:hypothetical protein
MFYECVYVQNLCINAMDKKGFLFFSGTQKKCLFYFFKFIIELQNVNIMHGLQIIFAYKFTET